MRVRRRLIALLAATLLLCHGPRALRAQTIVIEDRDRIPRVTAQGRPAPRRPATLTPEGLNRKDCTDDHRLRFVLQTSGLAPDGIIETWVADERIDCTSKAQREGECAKVASTSSTSAEITMDHSVRALLSPLAPFTAAKPAIDDEACGKIDRTALNVWFFYFAKDAFDAPLATARATFIADTIGPPPPTNIHMSRTAAQGQVSARVTATWDQVRTAESDLTGTQAFCAVNEGADSGECRAASLAADAFPPTAACGVTASAAATMMAIMEATRGHAAIALASVDALGNTGPLSELSCLEPAPPPPPRDDGCNIHASNGAGERVVLVGVLAALRALRS